MCIWISSVVINVVILSVVQLCEVGGEGLAAPLVHSTGVVELALNQGGSAADRQLAFVDRNRDLFLACVTQRGPVHRKCDKLGE